MASKTKFKCTSCQYIFEHDAYQKECFCPKCGNVSKRCEEEGQPVFCSECGTELPADAASCPTCGCPTSAMKQRHCNECGAELPSSASVCPQCGCPVESVAPVSPIPPVSITQTAAPMEVEEPELSLPPRNKAFYWVVCGVLLLLLVGAGVLYYTTEHLDDDTKTPHYVVPKQVVIDGTNLRMRYAPSPDAETFKWADGTNRHPEKGERYTYLGEENGFYKIDYKGHTLYVSKEHSHLE